MLQKLINSVFGGKKKTKPKAVKVYDKAAHGIGRDRLSRGALQTVDGLTKAGFQAYVVGGAVRDLLLGLPPKDFDVATNATPEQVHATFRRSRLIGRRFRIVHVLFGAETVEVSTFRTADLSDAQTDEHGRVLRDNTFGNMEEDATRRDFTINALYYDATNETVIDYHGGVGDLRKKTLRIIGDADTRFREAGLFDRPEDARADRRGRPAAVERAKFAPVRRNDEAAALGPRGSGGQAVARREPAPRPAADVRCDPRAADG